jgi:membrane protein DedA with SNARE-associated domain
METIMAITHTHARLSISGLGWGFSAALVVLFVLCMLSALFVPIRPAHGWVTLFSDAPLDSSRVWVDGLIWSIIAGWTIAAVFGTIYNYIVGRRAVQLIQS